MRIRKIVLLLTGTLAVALLALLVLHSLRHGTALASDDKPSTSSKNDADESQLTQASEGVRLTDEQLRMSDIHVTAVQSVDGHIEREVLGAVLPVQDLLDLTSAFRTAQVQLQRAQAAERASQLEYERLRQLNLDDKNVSDKAVQAAEATFQSDNATLRNAQEGLTLARAANLQRWGPVVSGWIDANSSSLQDVLNGRHVLLQVTFPDSVQATHKILIPVGQQTVEATLVSALPRVDPRFQKPTFLYQATGRRELEPGMNLSAFASDSRSATGVLLPRQAVLHWQGKAWVYVETSPGTFQRKEVELDTPTRDGWLVKRNLASGSRIVTTGAQQLLSQEFRAQTQAGGDND